MIIEPTPTNPRSPLRRALRLGALVVPVALLGVVVAGGLLGPSPDRPSLREPAGTAPSGTTPASAAAATPSASTPSPAVAERPAAPPTQFGDLPSHTVGEALAARRPGDASTARAVIGYMRGIGSVEGGCIDDSGGPLGPWCEREGTLGDASRAARDTPAGAIAPHLHLSIPVGVRLPPAGTATGEPADEDGQVLVVGRFEPTGPRCGIGPDSCEEVFVVERFAWANGVRVGLTPLIETRLDTGERRPNPFAFLDVADLPLTAALVWPDAVAALDPAAAQVAAAGPPSEPVWYVRALDGARGPGMVRNVRWMLLAERDLGVLGAGRPGSGGTDAAQAAPG